MDGREQYVAALVEDFLGAVAVVIIDVKDGYFAVPLVEESLGGNCGVVQVAVTTHNILALRCRLPARYLR
ncbi:hypothetical protein D3C79_742230 [compost metagenome]